MSRSEDFSNGIWSTSGFENLSLNAAILWIWTWTNPRCGLAGLYEIGLRGMAECKVAAENLDAALGELRVAPERFRVLYEDGVLFSWSRLERWRSKTNPCVKAVVKDVNQIGVTHPLRSTWLEVYGDDEWLVQGMDDLQLSITTEPHPSLNRASSEVHSSLTGGSEDGSTTADPEPHLSLNRASPEVQGTGKGLRTGTTTAFQGESEVDARAHAPSKSADQDALPSTLADELHPAAEAVLVVLARIYAERGGSLPTRRGVGLAIAAFAERDHVAVAGDLEQWALAGGGRERPIKDWAAQYRNFLTKATPGTPTRSASPRRRKASLEHLVQRS